MEETDTNMEETLPPKKEPQICHKDRFTIDKNGWTVVKEGTTQVLFPSLNDVFYNPVQEFNRDVSVAVIKQHSKHFQEQKNKKSKSSKESKASDPDKENQKGENETEDVDVENLPVGVPFPGGLKIFEGLSASGLRSIRYAKEIPGVENIMANDWSKEATESIDRNVKHNEVEELVTPSNGDASMVMYGRRNYKDRFDVIDLDPYGSPTPFLDAAVRSVADGGLLCVTATDMAILCGNAPETCYSKYGAIPLKSKCCHEIGLRIVLQCIQSHAARYGRYIQPLLSLSIDFYCRVFVRIYTSQSKVKESITKLGYVHQCTGCETISLQPLGRKTLHENGKNFKFNITTGPPVGGSCNHCSSPHHTGGPIWIDPIHDQEFVLSLLSSIEDGQYGTQDRLRGMLAVVIEELQDVPLYYDISRLCSIVRVTQGKLVDYRSAVLNAGYRVSLSHANKHAFKTDAPVDFIWDMLRVWGVKNDFKLKNLAESSPGRAIMTKAPTIENISFEVHEDANPESRKMGLKRFQINPEKNWGPKMRSKTSLLKGVEDEKSYKNQGKSKKKFKLRQEEQESKKLKIDETTE